VRQLTLSNLSDLDELASPTDDLRITLQSPVSKVFTDFMQHMPLVVESSTSAEETLSLMKKMHVRLKFVINEGRHFIGIVSREDLNSRSIIQKLADENTEREKLMVTDFMKPRSILKAFDFDEVLETNIGDVIETLKHYGEQHCLVVNRRNHQIRGIVSSSDIARKLHLDIDIHDRSSFVRIFEAVQLNH